MKPVRQTKFSNPTHESTGDANCLMAAVASVLELPLEAVPDFGMSGIGWFEEMYEWCLKQDIGIVYIRVAHRRKMLPLNCYCVLIFTVKDSTIRHAVVGKIILVETQDSDRHESKEWLWRADVAHDPNPNDVPLDTLEEIIFLIPHQRSLPIAAGAMLDSGR